MHRMVIFDDGLGQLGPMTDLRASFEVRTGMYTTAGRISAFHPKALAAYWVPQRLQPLVAERANAPVNELPSEEVLLCVNGRLALPEADLEPQLGEAVVEGQTGHVIASLLRHADAEYYLRTGQLHERVQIRRVEGRVLYKYPWDVLATAKRAIPRDIMSKRILDARIPANSAEVMGSHPVEIHNTAVIGPNVVFDAEQGPIIVHERAMIRPNSVICGPASIGADSTVIDRALIKPFTVIGPHCKVGGEIGSTMFQGFSNKSHDGHLGDSWVGRWVNFGAGTTNSNLLNTYGEVSMRLEPDGPRLRTGMQFLGAIVGDHVKFAINTRIMTGSVIGTGAMIATTAPPPTSTRRFAWLTDDSADRDRSFQIDKFLDTARAVMARRHVQMSAAYESAVRELYTRVADHQTLRTGR